MNQRAILKRMVGLVRSIDAWGINSLPWQQWKDMGVGLVLYEWTWEPMPDSTRIAQAIRNGRGSAIGMDGGVWFQVPNMDSPALYAQRVHDALTALDTAKANPHLVMLDLEGKSLDWMEQAIAEYRRLRPTRLTAVTSEPDKDADVFPHRAAFEAGMAYYPQCYGAKPELDHRHPDDIVGRVLLNNIYPHHMVKPMVSSGLWAFYAPGLIRSGCEGFAFFVLDDAGKDDALYGALVAGEIPGDSAALDRRAVRAAVAA